jgi:hypothetical protein
MYASQLLHALHKIHIFVHANLEPQVVQALAAIILEGLQQRSVHTARTNTCVSERVEVAPQDKRG